MQGLWAGAGTKTYKQYTECPIVASYPVKTGKHATDNLRIAIKNYMYNETAPDPGTAGEGTVERG